MKKIKKGRNMKKKDTKKIEMKLEIETLGGDSNELTRFIVSKTQYVLAMAKAHFNVIHSASEFTIHEVKEGHNNKDYTKGALHES